MRKRILFTFATLALAAMSAATHKVTIYQPVSIGGVELQPGDYKVELKDQTAVLTRGKQTVEAPVKVETASSKFNANTVRYTNTSNGKQTVDEIRLGGTNTVLHFNSTVSLAR